jgi:hypothetical protein
MAKGGAARRSEPALKRSRRGIRLGEGQHLHRGCVAVSALDPLRHAFQPDSETAPRKVREPPFLRRRSQPLRGEDGAPSSGRASSVSAPRSALSVWNEVAWPLRSARSRKRTRRYNPGSSPGLVNCGLKCGAHISARIETNEIHGQDKERKQSHLGEMYAEFGIRGNT